MLLSELTSRAGIDFVPTRDLQVTSIVPDSRRAERDCLYIAIEGLHSDGHAYIGEAVARGACAVVVSSAAMQSGRVDVGKYPDTQIITVEDCREASARLFSAFYGNPQDEMTLIGVTGTNGKTSVSRILYEIVTRSGEACGLIGTAGCIYRGEKIEIKPQDELANMTTPDPEELYKILAIMRDMGAKYVIMEVTSHALALNKVAPICFELAVFTNLSEDHLDFHGDMEGYYQAKKKLFAQSKSAIINCDDRYGRRLKDEIVIPRYTCSAEDRAVDALATDIRYRDECAIEYKLVSHSVRLRIRTALQGKFNVMNTLEAAFAAIKLGISPISVKESLAGFKGVDGRLERVKINRRAEISVYIDYAHTPDALENLLCAAHSMRHRGQRIVLLFGCGGEREREKRAMMGKIASSMADFVIVTSDNSRSEDPSEIIGEIVSGIDGDGHFTVIEDRYEAIEYAIKNARRGDLIFLAGKGHENYEINKDGRRDFCEKDIVCSLADKYYG